MKNTIPSARIIAAYLLVLTLAASAAWADFSYPDFQSIAGLNLTGPTAQVGDRVRIIPAQTYQIGAFWRQGLQSVGQGFSTTFEFQATNIGGALDAAGNHGFDRITFTLQTIGDNIPDTAGYDPIAFPRLKIWFDAYKDIGGPDFSSSTVWVGLNGVVLTQADAEALGIIWRDEAIHQVSINYAQQTLGVVVDGTQLVSLAGVDLAGSGLSNAYAGFQANTGAVYANEDILSWSFQSIPEPATILFLSLGGLLITKRR